MVVTFAKAWRSEDADLMSIPSGVATGDGPAPCPFWRSASGLGVVQVNGCGIEIGLWAVPVNEAQVCGDDGAMARMGSGAFRVLLPAGAAVLPVAVGVAVNQILSDGQWAWWWILVAVAFSAVLTWVTHLLTRSAPAATSAASAASAVGESEDQGQGPGERSVVISGDNSGIVSTGDNARNVRMSAEASGSGRVYQAGGNQTINE